ncbi:hypothetical protein CEXT_490441 [Caerostris extrusa]|uniref:Uncharacterized protein n=1 Tax=Caerostris extrusa TaxID=172846 RepID=A0AAV4XYD8_CAEEX|nr:hypothetical protein CEXT_490441 [Caerostris extrusa]
MWSSEVMNLNNMGFWEKIGIWTEDGLDIKDIVWPGGSPVPPREFGEVQHEDHVHGGAPYVNLVPPITRRGNARPAERCVAELPHVPP